jgi:hypothetical protein
MDEPAMAMAAVLKKIADGYVELFGLLAKEWARQQGGQGEHRPAPHAAAPGADHAAVGEPPGRDHLPAVGGRIVVPERSIPPPQQSEASKRLVELCKSRGLLEKAAALALQSYGVQDLSELDEVSALDILGLVKTMPASSGERSASVPRTGKALYAWTKDIELRHEVGMLKYLNGWGKLQDYPARMVDWDDAQVAAAYAEGTRKLASVVVGPCVIRESDPLKDLKLQIREGAYKLARANAGGEIPTSEKETRTMALIDTIAADACNGEMIGNLRDSVNEAVLRRVLAAIEEDIKALEAKA